VITGVTNWNYFYDPYYSNKPEYVGFLRAVIDSLQATLHPDAMRA
jgi:hypothetical protein